MIKLAGIGHVLLRVADEEASKRFYRDALGFRVAEQDPEHGGVFMTLGGGFHTLDITQHHVPHDAARPWSETGRSWSARGSQSRRVRACRARGQTRRP